MHQHQKTNESLEWSERNATRQSIIFLHFFAVWSWPNFFLCSCILFFCKNFDQKLPFPPSLQHSLAACPPSPPYYSLLELHCTTNGFRRCTKQHCICHQWNGIYLFWMDLCIHVYIYEIYLCIYDSQVQRRTPCAASVRTTFPFLIMLFLQVFSHIE